MTTLTILSTYIYFYCVPGEETHARTRLQYMDELPQLLLRASFGQQMCWPWTQRTEHAQEGGTRHAVAAALRTHRKGRGSIEEQRSPRGDREEKGHGRQPTQPTYKTHAATHLAEARYAPWRQRRGEEDAPSSDTAATMYR